MEDKTYLALSFVAVILGASGFGIGAYSAINFQMIEGPQGPQGLQGLPGSQGLPGQNGTNGLNGTDGINGKDGINGTNGLDGVDGVNGTDGRDAPGGIIVGILYPDYGETISGNVTIRAIIFGSEDYTISILRNGTEIGTSLPMKWNSLTVDDGWWNLTIVATDMATTNISSDEVLVFTKNYEVKYIDVMPNLIIPEGTQVFFNLASESVVHLPNSYTNMLYCLYRFVVPENYATTENIIFHLVWGAPGQNPTIDYALTFYYAKDGDSVGSLGFAQSSWTGAGQGSRNFETIIVSNLYINPGNLLMVKVYMENNNDLDIAFCYGVWLEVPVQEYII
ncbi:MAG: hypothetical protein ACXADY_25555 [Candidatus Hodarchaeales archaeon]|jgi:hypothetical protein